MASRIATTRELRFSELKEHLILQYQLLIERYKPSTHPFFVTLKHLPPEWVKSPSLLGNLYLNYQAATHAMRVMVYQLPHLNTPAFRKTKVQVFLSEDDAGDTHHYQLSRAFQSLGAEVPLSDEEFGDLNDILPTVEEGTRRFIEKVEKLYPKSLGAWVFMELISVDLVKALAQSLEPQFPEIIHEPYFKSCFEEGSENKHGMVAFDLLLQVLEQRAYQAPQLIQEVIEDAEEMAETLNDLWTGLERSLFQN